MTEKVKAALAPKPDGWIDTKLSWLFGASYRTRMPGLAAVAASAIPFFVKDPEAREVVLQATLFALGAGLAVTKEARVSGTR